MKIIIIGAGPGGYETAIEAAGRGIEVVLVEKGNIGGTCLNEGCIPTKVLCRSAEAMEEMKKASSFGVQLPEDYVPRIDFSRVMQRKSEVVEQLRSGVGTLLSVKHITLVRGRAVLKDRHTVTVYTDDAGACEYSGDSIIIASGSYPAPLRVPGGEYTLTSSDMLEIGTLPESLCVIGAGVIGLEFASVFRSFGCRVTVLEYCRQILPRFDGDLAKRLKQSLSRRGIETVTSASVQSVRKEGTGYAVSYLVKGALSEICAEKVLSAVGRRPAVEGIGLEQAGVEYGPKGIAVDGNMMTSVPGVYAIGDVTGRMMLAHVAVYQGLRALNHICGKTDRIDFTVVPSAVFTDPEAASTGLTEEECREQGIACRCFKSFFRANGKAVSMGQTDGFVKVVASDGGSGGRYRDGQMLGCHLYGPHSSDLVAEISSLIATGTTLDELSDIIHAHPTLSEVFRQLA